MKPWVDFKAIKASADFRPVLAHYGLEFKAKGPELVGLCPFHRDTRPSFRVNLEKQVFHCFGGGCGAKGNIIDFVSRKEGNHHPRGGRAGRRVVRPHRGQNRRFSQYQDGHPHRGKAATWRAEARRAH